MPFAIVNNASELFTSIVIDNEKGAYDAVKYLTSLGHKRIGIIKCKEDYYTSSERFNGYVKAMMEAGINLESQAIDDIEQCNFIYPKLSTVRADTDILGKVACRYLFDYMETEQPFNLKVVVPAPLVIRESVDKPL